MKKPLIGLTPSYDEKNGDLKARTTYLKALKAAGAIPLVLPLTGCLEDFKQLTDLLDGFLFTGGPDVHPFVFGEETLAGCGAVSPERDEMELKLLPLVMERQKPVFGICRGVQVINIALGGDIWQDISSQVHFKTPIAHSQPFSYSSPSHTVRLLEGSRLAQITGLLKLSVNSMHHQAVRKVASGLLASAYSADGLVEALELPDYPFFVGVQWHPEYLWERDESAEKLFRSFVSACVKPD